MSTALPLDDVRVIELGQLLAGPFCGQLLGDFGAEVIKVEDPGQGDPMRQWGREKPYGKSLWWPVVARNKKSVTCEPAHRRRARTCSAGSSPPPTSLVENFRPGTLERWGLAPETLWADQPRPDHHPGHRLRADRPYAPAPDSARSARRWAGFVTSPATPTARRPEPASHWATRWRRRSPAWARWWRCTSADAPAGARWWTRPSTRPCWR